MSPTAATSAGSRVRARADMWPPPAHRRRFPEAGAPAPRSPLPAGSPAAGRARGRLLPVALHDGGVADLGLVGVLAGVTAGATLPEQVPALVELHIDGAQPLCLGHRQP